MRNPNNILVGLIVLVLVAWLSVVGLVVSHKVDKLAEATQGEAKAGNPSFVQRGCFITSPVALTSATTGVSFIVAGKATTTLACDLASLPGSGAGIANKAYLALSHTGSSTASILDINIEYSNDNIDWYQDALSDRSTTTPAINGVTQTFRNQFASTTAGLPTPGANTATTTKMFTINTPTRYVRAVFTVPAGANASAIWAEISTIKEVHE